jgi:hypothetical protein
MTTTERMIIIMEHGDSLAMITGSELIAFALSMILFVTCCKD